MSETSKKNFPIATAQVANLLKMNISAETATGHKEHTSSHNEAVLPLNLPIADENIPEVGDHSAHKSDSASELEKRIQENIGNVEKSGLNAPKVFLLILPYLAVFGVGLIAYYFFFSGFDFSKIAKVSLKNKIQTAQQNTSDTVKTAKDSALQALEKQNMDEYQKWISQFYFDVTDAKVIDPETDNSGNGLSNFQKFMLKLNPKAYDTLGLGISDSEAIAKGINPQTGGALTETQKNLVDNYFDMEVIMNRLSLNKLQNAQNQPILGQNGALPQVAGAKTPTILRGVDPESPTVEIKPKNTGQVQGTYYAPITGPGTAAQILPSNPDEIDVNTSIPGRLEVPSLNINVPIIWSLSSKNFSSDLQKGVIHYPGTALPGQIGTTYISGHSSNYLWAKGDYNTVFSKLGELADNTSFKVTVVQKNGKDAILHYVVTSRKEYKPDDPAQIKNTGKSLVALSTCWPINTTQKRLVVFGELTQVEK